MHQVKITSLCCVLYNMSHGSHQLLLFQNGKKYQATIYPLLLQTNSPAAPVALSLPLSVCLHSPKIATTQDLPPTLHQQFIAHYSALPWKNCFLLIIYFAYKFYVFLANPTLLMNLSFGVAGTWRACSKRTRTHTMLCMQ